MTHVFFFMNIDMIFYETWHMAWFFYHIFIKKYIIYQIHGNVSDIENILYWTNIHIFTL